MYKKRIQVIIRHADPNNKTGEATKGPGVGVAKFDFTKTFRNQLFCTCKGITSSILDCKSQ